MLNCNSVKSPCYLFINTITKRWATNLGGASSMNGKDSHSKRLGVKKGHGASVSRNEIILRQRGYQYWPGENILVGRDHSFNSACDGTVHFDRDHDLKRTYVHIKPLVENPLPNPFTPFTLTNILRLSPKVL